MVFWFTFFAMLVPVVAISRRIRNPPSAGLLPKLTRWLLTGLPIPASIILMCKGSAVGAFSAIPASMAADVIDVDTAQTGLKRAGAYFSIWSMTRKMAFALVLRSVLPSLPWPVSTRWLIL